VVALMLRGLIELFTVFDWITPVVETAKDISYAVGDGSPVAYFEIDKTTVGDFQRTCGRLGITFISYSTVAFKRTAIVTIKDPGPEALMALQQTIAGGW
jgi:hypothetical protein